MSETSTIKLYIVYGTAPCILYHVCLRGGSGARPRATEPFTKVVIHVFPAVPLRVVAGLQQLLANY